ncbi:MAG: ABC transporter substrate-binding protein [Pseudomonadota bacterium]
MTLRTTLLSGIATVAFAGVAHAACPPATVADMAGLTPDFPQQFELSEFEEKAGCELTFAQNPNLPALNGEILGNDPLPPVAERLPAEPLVVAPYTAIGTYGGTIRGLSNATEAGTSDLLSVRHVNLVRYSDDLKTIVPNVAKSFSVSEDGTSLTFELREGHKWSDGAPFTTEDVRFWYEDIILNADVYEKTPDRWLWGGEPMTVTVEDETTITFTLPRPAPGLLARFAVDYGQPFQPKHVLGRFMEAHNPDFQAALDAAGFETTADAIDWYYGGSDWKDVPQPLLKDEARARELDPAVLPTLESHIVVDDTADGRRLVANPYFHMVDTAGNQLPYIDRIDERYVPEKEVRNLAIINGDVTWKQQAIFLEDFPLLKENEANGNYTISFAPTFGENVFYSVNRTHKDPVLRDIFNDVRFSQALSVAMNRDEINEIVYLGQGTPAQGVPAEPKTVDFVTEAQLTAFTQHDPAKANALLDEMGLADSDGDGTRERPDGDPLVLRLVYSNQGAPVQMHELIRDYWDAIGVRLDLREVTSDEYRASGNNNDLDITVWKYDNTAGPTISQDVRSLVPPFGDYFNPGTGFAWAAWTSSDGAEGTEPPQYVKDLYELSDQFIQETPGSDEANALGAQIVDIHVDNLLKIGTVGDILGPFMYHNTLNNVQPLTAKAYDFYWTYPYRPQQWFLAAE